jgi:hypothetical protein
MFLESADEYGPYTLALSVVILLFGLRLVSQSSLNCNRLEISKQFSYVPCVLHSPPIPSLIWYRNCVLQIMVPFVTNVSSVIYDFVLCLNILLSNWNQVSH